MKLIRRHLSPFYDELWQDLLQKHYGIKIRAYIPPQFNPVTPTLPLTAGFTYHKPKEFTQIDRLLATIHFGYDSTLLELIQYADNRMKQGDYRYGVLRNQDLHAYDLTKNYNRRIQKYKQTDNPEYLVDAYNMIRIGYYKKEFDLCETIAKASVVYTTYYYARNILNQESITIDDGEHAI